MYISVYPTHVDHFLPVVICYMSVHDLRPMGQSHRPRHWTDSIQYTPVRLQDFTIDFSNPLDKGGRVPCIALVLMTMHMEEADRR
jgi:hypothetical protein